MTNFSYLFKTVAIFPSSREVVVQTVTTSISEYPSLPKSINVAVFCRFGQFGCLWKKFETWLSLQRNSFAFSDAVFRRERNNIPPYRQFVRNVRTVNKHINYFPPFNLSVNFGWKSLKARASSFPKNKNPISFFSNWI